MRPAVGTDREGEEAWGEEAGVGLEGIVGNPAVPAALFCFVFSDWPCK